MVRARRRWLYIVGAIVVVVLIILSILSGFYVDVLWFREVELSGVFWTVFWTRVLMGAVFGVAFFALLYVNLLIVRRLTPRYRVFSPQQEAVERYRLAFEPYIGWLLPAFAALIALFVAVGVSQQWETFLLWRGSGGIEFGRIDPIFDRDVSYYVFQLPFLEFVQGWLFSSLVGVTVIVAIAHYLWGGIRTQGVGERVAPQVKVHLSVLLGLIVLTKAWGYWLGQFHLLLSPRGVVTGASYTDVNAQLPALRLLVIIAIACALLFLVNIRFRGWALPVIGVGLLAVTSIVAGAIYPAFIQRFRVAPQELQRERQYIEYNLEATRFAFGLDQIQSVPGSVGERVDSSEVADNQGTVENIRVWSTEILGENLLQLQRSRQFYEFADVDVDRYQFADEQRVVMIAAREVSQEGIPQSSATWQNRHLVYTHGFGVVANQVNTATPEGAPVFTVRDIPPVGEPLPQEPRIYYGELEEVPFVVVNTGADELDYQGTDQQDFVVAPEYTGRGGIPVGGFFQRLLFAWRFRDVNLLISDLMTGDSRIMINREIRTRATKVAPFLKFDGDPYVAVVGGRIVWIQDAYTTSNGFPYSEETDLTEATAGALEGQANYIRNSVKIAIDAYDGSLVLYVVDEQDPIIRVWQSVFPDLFTPASEVPDELQAHFRYPENLFQVQAVRHTNYHVTSPEVFYGGTDRWAVPGDPTTAETETESADALRPYYVRMRVPGEDDESFVLFLPFTPENRQIMVAWLAAKSDPDSYGELVSLELPAERNITGPTLAFNLINQDREFASERTLLGQGGSEVRFGNLLVVPIGQSFLYVLPVFVRSDQEDAIPELKRVVVVNGGVVGIGENLGQALADALTGEPPPEDGEPPPDGEPPTGTVDEQVAALIQDALEHFAAAEAALQSGDLALYQDEIEAAEELIRQAEELLGGPVASPTPEPSPSPSPTG
jgi:uncharacterized protein